MWGMGFKQELCKIIFIYYLRENWDDYYCESFKNIFLCVLEIGDFVFGCMYCGFMLVLYNDLLYDMIGCVNIVICFNECLQKMIVVCFMFCLFGDMYDLWKFMVMFLWNDKLIIFFKVYVVCEEQYMIVMLEVWL